MSTSKLLQLTALSTFALFRVFGLSPAEALTVSVSTTQPADNGSFDPYVGDVGTFHMAGVGTWYTGAPPIQVYPAGTNISGITAAPWGGNSDAYLTIGGASGGGAAALLFDRGVESLSFSWGSIDLYNKIELWYGNNTDTVIDGNYIANHITGPFTWGSTSAFVTITSDGAPIESASFFSDNQAAFEVQGLTVSAPEPSTWAMMLMGFVGLGYAASRKARYARLTV